jgi:rhodanese-related sulfurtransferase
MRYNFLDIPLTSLMDDPSLSLIDIPYKKSIFIICRFGNDSQLAIELMKEMENDFPNSKDIKDGLDAWAETFSMDVIPKY